MIRKIFYFLSGTVLIALVIGAMIPWNFSEVDKLLHAELAKVVSKDMPVNVSVGKSLIRLIPLELTVQDVHIEPKKNLNNLIQPVTINAVSIQPSLWNMVFGKLYISTLKIDTALIALQLQQEKEQKTQDVDIFNILAKIPISRVELNNLRLKLKTNLENETISTDFDGIQATVIQDKDFVNLNLAIHQLTGNIDNARVIDKGSFATKFILTRKNLVLTDFKLKDKGSFIVASGTSQIDLKKKTFGKGSINIRTETNSEKIRFLYKLVTKKDSTPLDKLSTMLRGDFRLALDGKLENSQVHAEVALFDFRIEKFRLGNIAARASYNGTEKHVKIDELRLTNKGVTAFTKSTTLNLDTLQFSDLPVHVKAFHLIDYLDYSIQEKITTNVDASGDVNCSGNFKKFHINCTGNLLASHASVKTGNNEPIVYIDEAHAHGSVDIDLKEVTYKAEIQALNSSGTSSGSINYDSGFLIHFETAKLNVSNLKSISKLELTGNAKVVGSTQGGSKSATFELAIDGQNMTLNHFKLGDISTQLKYKNNSLFFDKIQGSLISSRYLGELQVDLAKDQLTGKIQFPFVDLAIVQDSIKEQLDIPVPIAGSGSAVVVLSSPLNIDELGLQAKARMYNCKIDEQHVDNIDVDVISQNGKMQLRSAYMEEKATNVKLTGFIDIKNKEYDLGFSSKRLHLEDLAYSNRILKVKGTISIDGSITKSFRDPQIAFSFFSDEFFYLKQSLSPLKGKVVYSQRALQTQLIAGDRFKFNLQNTINSPFYEVDGTTNNFDLSPLISTFLDSDYVDSFKFLASSKFNIKAPKTNTEYSSGYIQFSEMSVVSNANSMSLEKPTSIFLTNGKVNFSPFNITGNGGQLHFSSASGSTTPIDVRIAGLFSLSFMQVFAPFLETMEGQTTINLQLKFGRNTSQMLGSAYIEDGYIKLAELPHAVESMKADILFNQDKIVLNAINGKFATGNLIGDGMISIKGSKNLPMALNLHLDNINLNLPPQVNTRGNANLRLTGNWLPFTLSGDYDIFDGSVTREFSSSSDSSLESPYQIFLPQALREKSVFPIALDLKLEPKNPIAIKNSLLDGKVEGKLKVQGFPQQPSLTGRISLIKNSLINFKDAQFRVSDSNITFRGQTPPNPDLYITANTNYKGYAIEMQVIGTAQKQKFKFSSQPSLSEQEIISLLALGYTSDTSLKAQANSQSSTTNQSSFGQSNTNSSNLEVGTGLFSQNPLGKEFKDRFGFDVQFSSSFDTASSVAVPKVTLGKKFSDKISGSVTAQSGQDRKYNAKIRYEINKDIYGTAGITSQAQEEANQTRGNLQSDVIGVDIEYRKEFK